MNLRKIARNCFRQPPLGTILILLALSGCAATPTSRILSETNVAAATAKGCELLPDQDRSTIVIFEPSAGRKLVCNDVRSRQRFVPASTYKIPHSLIALQTRAVVDENSKFEWDGHLKVEIECEINRTSHIARSLDPSDKPSSPFSAHRKKVSAS